MKMWKKLSVLLLGALCIAALSGTAVFAAVVDRDRSAALTVHTLERAGEAEVPVDGVTLRFYQLAELGADGSYSLKPAYSALGIDVAQLTGADAEQSLQYRGALRRYIRERGIAPDEVQRTEQGSCTLRVQGARQGLYYIAGDPLPDYRQGEIAGKPGQLSYVPGSALASVPAAPNGELGTDYWDYIPSLNLKYSTGGIWIDPPVVKEIEVTDQPMQGDTEFTFLMEALDGAPLPQDMGWKESAVAQRSMLEMPYRASEAGQPKEFGTVWFQSPGIYRYLIYEDAGNAENFSYDSTRYNLTVEISVDESGQLSGTKTIETVKDGRVTETVVMQPEENDMKPFRFRNTYTRKGEKKPGGGGGGGGGGGSSVTRRQSPPAEPQITETVALPPETPQSGVPEAGNGRLPKTGMLWWPVPVLASAGLLLLLLGLVMERRRRNGD